MNSIRKYQYKNRINKKQNLVCILLWEVFQYLRVFQLLKNNTVRCTSWKHNRVDRNRAKLEDKFCIQSTSQFHDEVNQYVDQTL